MLVADPIFLVLPFMVVSCKWNLRHFIIFQDCPCFLLCLDALAGHASWSLTWFHPRWRCAAAARYRREISWSSRTIAGCKEMLGHMEIPQIVVVLFKSSIYSICSPTQKPVSNMKDTFLWARRARRARHLRPEAPLSAWSKVFLRRFVSLGLDAESHQCDTPEPRCWLGTNSFLPVAYEMIVVWLLWVLCIFPQLSCTPFLTDPALKTHMGWTMLWVTERAHSSIGVPATGKLMDRKVIGIELKHHSARHPVIPLRRGCTLSIVSLVRGFLDATWCPYNFKNEAKSGFFGFQLAMEGTLTWSEMSHL